MDYEAFLKGTDRPGRIKRELPVTYVLEVLAQCQLHTHGQRAITACPLHNDSSPSLEVWQAGDWQKWGCWPCGQSGDVLDLLRALYGLTFGQALDIGEQAVRTCRAVGWVGPHLTAAVEWDQPKYVGLMARAADQAPLETLMAAKSWPAPASWVRDHFWVGGLHGEVLIPFYNAELELVGMKHRRGDGSDHPYAFPGSKLLGVWYGEHNLRSSGPVVLCEGESDVWTASYVLRDASVSVLGLPAGAGTTPFRLDELAGRTVHICLDGDEAGRKGARRWADGLASGGADVKLWDLPDGQDVTSLGGPSWLVP